MSSDPDRKFSDEMLYAILSQLDETISEVLWQLKDSQALEEPYQYCLTIKSPETEDNEDYYTFSFSEDLELLLGTQLELVRQAEKRRSECTRKMH